jgi:hypothetical protein
MAKRNNTLLLKRSNVSGKIPSSLKLGELALNIADGVAYMSATTANKIVQIGWDKLSLTGGTMTGNLIIPTISATTYSNLPLDVYSTGGTYSNGTLVINNNNGNSFSISGFSTGSSGSTSGGTSTNLVPYSGATQDVDLGEYQLKADSLAISTTSTEPINIGKIVWNSNDGTFNMGLLNGVTLQSGQEMYFYAKASESITNGDAIQFNGSEGDHLLIKKAVPSEINTNPEYFIGIATQNFANNDFGYVTVFGKVRGLDTTIYTNPILYFDSENVSNGKLKDSIPSAPNAKIIVAAVVRNHATQGILMVRPHTMPKLESLQNVKISGTTNNQSLVYNSTTELWENKSLITQTILSGNTGTTSSETAVFNALNLKANNNAVVLLTGNQTIAGVKTFTSEIIVNNGIRVGLGNANGTNLVVGNAFGSGLNASSSGNIAIGSNALSSIGTGVAVSNNIAIGSLALQVGTQMTNNVAIGTGALRRIAFSSHSNNVALGFSSGELTNSGGLANAINQCTLIGSQTTTLNASDVNSIVIGFQGRGNGSNTVTLGNTSIIDTFLRGRVNIQQYTTATRPVYSKGAIIFDSTLNKLLIGGATTWEVISST